jgi:uncharacterized protein (TIRG00374 family)
MSLDLLPPNLPPNPPSAVTGLVVRVALTCATVAVLAFAVDWRSVVSAVVQANATLLAASVALLLIRIPIMAARWRLVLTRLGVSLPLSRLTQTLFLSTTLGLALPSSNGNDVIRSLMLLRDGRGSSQQIIAGVFIDRLIGLLTLLLIALPSAGVFLAAGKRGTAIFIAVVALCIAAIFLMIAAGRYTDSLPGGVPSSAARNLEGWLRQLVSGMAFALASPDLMAKGALLSAWSQVFAMASAWLAGLAVGLEIPPLDYIAAMPLIWVLTAIPLTISGIGMREGGLVILLAPLGIGATDAASLGVMISITGILTAIAGATALPLYLSHRKAAQGSAPGAGTGETFGRPLLIVAGFPRSGTTSIFHNLERHPDFATTTRKELNLFLSPTTADRCSAEFDRVEKGRICVDASPLYSLDTAVPARIHAVAPQARVVLVVREPVRWAWSVYCQMCTYTPNAPSFREFLAAPELRGGGFRVRPSFQGNIYRETLRAFAACFGDQLLVVDFALFSSDPVQVLHRIESFAGATSYFSANKVDARHHNSSAVARRFSPIVRMVASSELLISAAESLLSASLLKRARAYLYHADSSTPREDPSPMSAEERALAQGATLECQNEYRELFRDAPFRSGAELR